MDGSDLHKRAWARAAENFARDASEHVVRQLHRDGDVVKLWRCGRPRSSVYMFYVCSAPNCLMTYGDMGECMWQRQFDMLPFVRGSIESVDYFAEKVPHSIKIREDKSELVEEWLDELKSETVDCGIEWTDKLDEELFDLREWWSLNECDFDSFRREIVESAFYNNDCEDMPDFRGFTYTYMWICEGLRWFIAKHDDGEVLPYEEAA